MFPAMIVFDKDGTLIDNAAWDRIFGDVLDRYVEEAARARAADSFGYDLEAQAVVEGSPILWESNEWFLDRLAPFADTETNRRTFDTEVEHFVQGRAIAYAIEIPGATALLDELHDRGVMLAVCTNDSEASAQAQIARLGWAERLPLIVGYDSGHGAKPDPGMLRHVIASAGVRAEDAVMVGDSSTDVDGATAAGMRSVYIGTDPELIGRATHSVGRLRDIADLFA